MRGWHRYCPCPGPKTDAGLEVMGMNRKGFIRLGVALWCAMVMLLSGCATSRGFGQDVQSLGRDIEKSAK